MHNVKLLSVASILKHVVYSVAEAEMGDLFINMKEVDTIMITL